MNNTPLKDIISNAINSAISSVVKFANPKPKLIDPTATDTQPVPTKPQATPTPTFTPEIQSRIDKVRGMSDEEIMGNPINMDRNIPDFMNFVSPTPSPATQTNPTAQAAEAMGGGRNPSFSKFTVTDETRSSIQKASKEFGVPQSLLYDIALQESSLDPYLKNPQKGSTAAGLFQFTDGTWETVKNYAKMKGSSLKFDHVPDKMNPEDNARAAAYLIKYGQLGRWDASKGVWGPYYKEEELKSYYSQTK